MFVLLTANKRRLSILQAFFFSVVRYGYANRFRIILPAATTKIMYSYSRNIILIRKLYLRWQNKSYQPARDPPPCLAVLRIIRSV